MAGGDYRNLAIRHLTEQLIALEQAIQDERRQKDTWRQIAQRAIHGMADMHKRLEAVRAHSQTTREQNTDQEAA